MKIRDLVVGECYVTVGEPWITQRWLPQEVAVVRVDALEIPPHGGYAYRQARIEWVSGRTLDDLYVPAGLLICTAAEWEIQMAVQTVVAARVDEQVADLETRATDLQLQLAAIGYQDVVITIAPSYEHQTVLCPTTIRAQYEHAEALLAAFCADAGHVSLARAWEHPDKDIDVLIDVTVQLGLTIDTDAYAGELSACTIFSDLPTLERVAAALR